MKHILLLFLPIIFLLGCNTNKNQQLVTLSPIDSLGWDDNADYAIQAGSMRIQDGKLYYSDMVQCEISIFDLNDFSLINRFGQKGKAPGEFTFPQNFVVKADEIYICDTGNHRVQVLDKNGNFIKQIKTTLPYYMHYSQQNVLFSSFEMRPDLTVNRMLDDSSSVLIDMEAICEQFERKSRKFKAIETDNEFIVIFDFDDVLFLRADKSDMNFKPFEITGNCLKINAISNIDVCDDFIYFIGNQADDKILKEEPANSTLLKEELNLTEVLYKIDYSGKVHKSWILPKNTFAGASGLAVGKKTILLQDMFSGIIYKFENK
jgi:hypothetical protein